MEKVTVNVKGMGDDWEASGDAAVVIVLEKAEDGTTMTTGSQLGNLEAVPPHIFADSVGRSTRQFLEYIAMKTGANIRNLVTTATWGIIGPEIEEEKNHE